jgi:DNA polymerase
MHFITLNSETDFAGWRLAARTLVLNEVRPSEVWWRARSDREPELFEPQETSLPLEAPEGTFNVPAKFVELARAAILHRDPERFAILYRLLWRLKGDHDLLTIATDPDVSLVTAMAQAVQREAQRMRDVVRFREIGREQKAHYVAWFEPEHHIVEATAPFFASRFADMPWSILTPDVCAHWDGHAVTFTEGIAEAPGVDRLEETWRRYAAADIFDPARVRTEISGKSRRNLPKAAMIDPVTADAEPHTPQSQPEPSMNLPSMNLPSAATTESLATLREEAAHCRACPLWKDATQTVFGEGPQHAKLMLVAEQPGDKEDLAGRPFVGPAGQVLNRALEEAGIDRKKTYITGAVKHFKFVPRGKIRLHQKPNTPEIKACRPWYERELASIKPELVVAMGATAAQCVFGKITPVNKSRGRLIDLGEGIKALVTVHPSYLLRLPGEDAKAAEYARFVDDLKMAAEFLRKSQHAA